MPKKFNKRINHILFDSIDFNDFIFVLSDGLYQREHIDDTEYTLPSSKNIIYGPDKLSYLYKVPPSKSSLYYILFNKNVFFDPSVTLHDFLLILAPYKQYLTIIHEHFSDFLTYYEKHHHLYHYKKLERRKLIVEHRSTIHDYELKSYYDGYTDVYIDGNATIYFSDISSLLNHTITLNNNFIINYFACPPNHLEDIIPSTVSAYSNLIIEYKLFDVIKALFTNLQYDIMTKFFNTDEL